VFTFGDNDATAEGITSRAVTVDHSVSVLNLTALLDAGAARGLAGWSWDRRPVTDPTGLTRPRRT
jgi:hypothetical protein